MRTQRATARSPVSDSAWVVVCRLYVLPTALWTPLCATGVAFTPCRTGHRTSVPVLLHFAENDGYIPMTAVESVKTAFGDRDNVRIDVYGGVDHGFNCWGDRCTTSGRQRSLVVVRRRFWLASSADRRPSPNGGKITAAATRTNKTHCRGDSMTYAAVTVGANDRTLCDIKRKTRHRLHRSSLP